MSTYIKKKSCVKAGLKQYHLPETCELGQFGHNFEVMKSKVCIYLRLLQHLVMNHITDRDGVVCR